MFVTVMLAIIFTLISITEFMTGFQWGYRILNVIALSCWWLYYRKTKEYTILGPASEPVEPVEHVELDEMNTA